MNLLMQSIWLILVSHKDYMGKNPAISHLCLFGSIVYMHVPDQERSKLDNHSEKYVFIGMIQALKVISCEIQVP